MLVKFGGGILAASGSVGGQTFARNRYGNYVRTKTKPVNPSSDRQQYVRNLVSSMVEHWGSILTQDQRDAWNTYANAIDWLNKLGETITLSGFNHFIRSNVARVQAGGSVIADGPTELTLPGTDSLFEASLSEASQEISVAFDNTLGWANETGGFMSISMSAPAGGGRSFIQPQMRWADVIKGDNTTAPTSPATIACPFPVAEGQRVIVQARIIRLDGRLSAPFRDTAEVAA